MYKDEEIERILGGIDRHHLYGARNAALVRLLLDGGLRLNEACKVRIQDVDWSTGRIHIRWESAKRRKEREAYVGRRTLLELGRYVEDYRPREVGSDLVFIDQDQDYGPLTPHAVQSMLSRLKKKLGLAKLSAYQFRRTWATNYRRMGVGDLFDLQQEGGWEDPEVPQRFYVAMDPVPDQPPVGARSVGDRATETGAIAAQRSRLPNDGPGKSGIVHTNGRCSVCSSR
jgi:integrase